MTSRPPAPHGLAVGDRARPLCVNGSPAFGWLLRHTEDGEGQTAYQIQVSRQGGPDAGSPTVWDSGWVWSSTQSYVPYRGPGLAATTGYTWRVRITDRAGRQSGWSTPASFETGLGDADWQAHWIRRRPEDADDERDHYTLSRRELTVAASPVVRARVYIASCHQHDLRLNGRLVVRGPAFAYPDNGYYQAADVTRLLEAGRQAVMAVVTHWHGPGQGRPAGQPGLIMRLVIEHADGTCQVVRTDGSWRVRRGPWLPAPTRNDDGRDFVERIDGRALPRGWDRPGFDDAGWETPELLGVHPTTAFPHLQGQEPGMAVAVVRPARVLDVPGGMVADFGQVIPARPLVRFTRGLPGRAVHMRAGYLLDQDGSVSETNGIQETDLSYAYLQREGGQVFEPFTYLGFRYLQVDCPASVSAEVQHTDVDPATRASFACSDGTVTEVFELALRSALYSSQWQFLDTPTREKGQFLADAASISRALMAGFKDRVLTRKAIREFIESQHRYWPDGRLNAVYPNGDGKRDIPDFTALFPGWTWDYYMESGDAATLEAAYPVMVAIAGYLLHHRSPKSGLVTGLSGGSGPYAGGIVDWPPTMRYGYDMGVAARTTVNMLAVDALRRTCQTGTALNRPAAETGRYAAAADSLRDAITARLRRSDGLYVDGLREDGSPSAHASQIANAYALAYGIAPDATKPAVGAYVAGLGMRMGPMTACSLLAAMASCGRIDSLLERLTDGRSPGWAKILEDGGTFTWESWDAPETGASLSHGWGATVLVAIQRFLLGVSPLAPGWARARVRPAIGNLDWARGRLPTQRGDLSVEWHREHTSVWLCVEVPANVEAEVHVPPASQVRVTGRAAAAPVEDPDGRLVYIVGSGATSFEIS